MENRRLLNWRSWSAVRKAALVGGVAGTVLSLGISLLRRVTEPHELGDPSLNLWGIIFTLPKLIVNALGISATIVRADGTISCTSSAAFCLMVLINASLYSLAGTAIGWFLSMSSCWSLRRKSGLIGAVAGALVWPGVGFLDAVLYGGHEPFTWLDLVYFALTLPASAAHLLFSGRQFELYGGQTGYSTSAVALVISTNSLLGFLAGIFVGWLLSIGRRTRE
jgi:hypothetical protein